MNWHIRLLGFSYRNFIFARRNFFSFMELLFWPVVGLLTIGLMGEFLSLESRLRDFILTGVIASGILQITQVEVSYGILYDVWSKSFKHTFLAPITHLDYLIGSWIIGIIRGLLAFLLLIVLANRFYGFQLPAPGVSLIFLTGIFLNALLIGTLVSTLLLIFGQNVEISAWSMVALIMLVCGIYYPVSYLPSWVRAIAEWIPLTYFLEETRRYYGFPPLYSHGLVKGFASVLIYEAIALYLLQRSFLRSCRNGKIISLSE